MTLEKEKSGIDQLTFDPHPVHHEKMRNHLLLDRGKVNTIMNAINVLVLVSIYIYTVH